jgi:hypothetical protein
MGKGRALAPTLLVLAVLVSPAAAAELRATFIGNMAFHITDGRVAIVTDFPYEGGYSGYMRWSADAVPKGPRPLCLITHSHRDHFLGRLAGETCGRVLGPKDVVAASATPSVALAPEVHWEGLAIRPVATPHGPLEHYSYVVEWNGIRLYFTGDTDDTAALLAARGLDVAFVSPWLLRAVERNHGHIDARQIVVYHHRADETVPPFQGRIVPAQGQVLKLEP